MRSTSRLAAAILSVGLIMQFGTAAAMDDMKKDTMGKDGHAMQKDAMGDCPDQAAMGRDKMMANDKMAMANDKMAGDGMKKDATGHDAMASKDTMKKGAASKDCTPGAMKKGGTAKDGMGHDAMKQ